MKARLHTRDYRFQFQGSPLIWNEFFRPLLGGPTAPDEPAPPAAPVRAPQPAPFAAVAAPVHAPPPPAVPSPRFGAPQRAAPPATAWTSHGPERAPAWPRGPQERFSGAQGPPSSQRETAEGTRVWSRRPGGLEPTLAVEPSSDPRTLYDRLSTLESRRGERDAVLAAIWFLGRGEKDVAPEEVERHLRDHGGPPDVKVRPVMLKHVTRTKLLEQGGTPGTVRLTPKGAAQARMLVGA